MSAVHSLLLALALLAPPAQPTGPRVGSAVPDTGLPSIHGELVPVRSGNGTVTVVTFVAFWCDTWKEAMPHLRSLSAASREERFALTMVSVDGTRREQFERLCRPKADFPVLLDIGSELTEALGVRRVPTVLVVDAGGVVRRVFEGYPGNAAIIGAVHRCQLRKEAPH